MLALRFLLGICLRSLWSPLFPLHALALIPLSLAKVRLSPTLTLSPLMIWCFGLMTVPFPFGKGGSGVLANSTLCGAEDTLSFLAGPECSSISAEACAILHALRWSRQHQQVCHFSSLLLLSDSCSVLSSIFPLISKLSGRSGRNCLLSLSVLLDYNGSPNTRFSRGTTRLMSWPDGERYLHPPQSLVICLLLSLVSTLVFSRTGDVLPHRSSLTHRFPRFPPRNLCSLVTLAVPSLVFAATDTAFF